MNRREFLRLGLAGGAGLLMGGPLGRALAQGGERRRNVLFIAVDDLRPSLGCYGAPVVQTPSLDRLAARGTVFTRAYCQQAVCSPSRTSLLTGRRPDTTQVYDLQTHFRKHLPNVVTLPEHFKANGYHTEGMGKIYHGGLDDPQSWSVPHWNPKGKQYLTEASDRLLQEIDAAGQAAGVELKQWREKHRGPAWEAPDVPDNALSDGRICDHAVEALQRLQGRPFFLGVGFLKPHLPFIAPKRYYDLYDPARIALADNPFAPQDAPQYALSSWGELRAYHAMPAQGPVDDATARQLIHGYYAATSYVDAQVGRLLDELQRLALLDSTVIVLWGDHGWQLGEHGMWCKHTNYETSVWSPLLVSVPGQRPARCQALVEFVDLYPSLCELCGLPATEGLEGCSFAPLLADPARPWKTAAFSQYPRSIPGHGPAMGHSLRTDRYRFTEWRARNDNFCEYELYDHQADPKENVNLARRPEQAELVKQLAAQLQAGWQGALPPR